MAALASRLIDRVSIEIEQETPNGQGGFESAWTSIGTAAAEVKGLSGTAAFTAGIERDVNQWRVTLRRRDDLTAKHRLQWLRSVAAGGALRLEIKSVMPDPKQPQDATLLLCESGA
jgi:head-tail adaptor